MSVLCDDFSKERVLAAGRFSWSFLFAPTPATSDICSRGALDGDSDDTQGFLGGFVDWLWTSSVQSRD